MTSIDELLGEARAFLDATLELRNDTDEKFVWGEGSDRVNILEETEASEMTRRSWLRPSATRPCGSTPGSGGSTARSSTAAAA